jgi:hypothetical protein
VRGLTVGDIQVIGRAYREFLNQAGDCRIAIVVSSPDAFGLVRMAEARAGDPEPQRITYSRDQAMSWLLAPRN